MQKKFLTILCLITLLGISSPIVSAQTPYKIYFNNIVCLNPWNIELKGDWEIHEINKEFMRAEGKLLPPIPGLRFDPDAGYSNPEVIAPSGETQTRYFNNMSFANFPADLFNEARYKDRVGSSNSNDNDRFYITYKNAARQGMVLPVRGGDKDMYRFAFWKPTAADGNPALAGGDSITYYLWEADVITGDNSLGQFAINLKEKKGKGPQLVQVARGHRKGVNDMGRNANNNGHGGKPFASSIYVIEYEVK